MHCLFVLTGRLLLLPMCIVTAAQARHKCVLAARPPAVVPSWLLLRLLLLLLRRRLLPLLLVVVVLPPLLQQLLRWRSLGRLWLPRWALLRQLLGQPLLLR